MKTSKELLAQNDLTAEILAPPVREEETMNRVRTSLVLVRALLCTALLFAGLGYSNDASAQSPDIREIAPTVLLLMDTSGSMEKLGNCQCSTPTCEECLPDCGSLSPERNRWNTVVESLTGTMNEYRCVRRNRSEASWSGRYDYRYYLPHIERQMASQEPDGILDVYRDRVRFAFMSFDATSTFTGQGELMPRREFEARLPESFTRPGGFSYGEARPFSFPGCGEPYMINNGMRSESAENGQMVSVGGSDLAAPELAGINEQIQQSLLTVRPFGATPIAGMLEDVQYYVENHVDVREWSAVGGVVGGDRFHSCRRRYAILLTDGRPNQDMRGAPYNCDALAAGVGEGGCPYDTSVNTAARLVADGVVEGLYVVGFSVSPESCPAGDAECRADADQVVADLNDLAAAGNTTEAIFANNREELDEALVRILDSAAPGTTTRTVPAFGNVTSTGTNSGAQHQFNTGFQVSTVPGEPWEGVLERRRFECEGLDVVRRDIEDRDRFHVQLRDQTDRRLYTVIPPMDATGAVPDHVSTAAMSADLPPALPRPVGETGENVGWSEGVTNRIDSGNSMLAWQRFGIPADRPADWRAERRTDIIDWLHGDHTDRASNPLGAIVHSSPVVVSAPQQDVPDDSFNAFRQLPQVAGRPTILYVGTNDGILHAFAADDHTYPPGHELAGTTVDAGTELWGFIPPMLHNRMNSLMAGHQWMTDATPVVKEVFDARPLGSSVDAARYHTVLVSGFRQGGTGYFAMDVSDPTHPQFLWQFSHESFGQTYAEPHILQARVEIGGVAHERGIVLLQGGYAAPTGGACEAETDHRPERTERAATGPRRNRRCWGTTGRSLIALDLSTGTVLREWGPDDLGAPVTGGMASFPAGIGAIASRAFFNDADGIMWRLDLSQPRPEDWAIRPFHDMFHGRGWAGGQPAYNAPVLSVDDNDNLIVLQATGDVDHLEDYTSVNRVVSLREEIDFDESGDVTNVTAYMNWEITLEPGEQVTGPLDLFDSKVFFGTFRSMEDPANACDFGFSRLWGVEYLRDNESEGGAATEARPALESVAGSGVFDVTNIGPETDGNLDNRLIMGVSVTRRPTCLDTREATETDPYLGSRQTYRVDRAAPPQYQLSALLSGGETGGAGGGAVQELSRTITPPISYVEVTDYVPVVE